MSGEKELWVPADRFVALIDREYGTVPAHFSFSRQVARARREQQFVSLSTVDRILCALDLTEWLHMPESLGGLADIYEDGKQYGGPPPPPVVWKYKSDVERLAARREQWRRREEKRRAGNDRYTEVPVRCSGCGRERLVQKWYAPKAAGRRCKLCVSDEVQAAWAKVRAEKAA